MWNLMKKYLRPEMELLEVNVSDIITASNSGLENDGTVGTGGLPTTGVLPYGTGDVTIFSDN